MTEEVEPETGISVNIHPHNHEAVEAKFLRGDDSTILLRFQNSSYTGATVFLTHDQAKRVIHVLEVLFQEKVHAMISGQSMKHFKGMHDDCEIQYSHDHF